MLKLVVSVFFDPILVLFGQLRSYYCTQSLYPSFAFYSRLEFGKSENKVGGKIKGDVFSA